MIYLYKYSVIKSHALKAVRLRSKHLRDLASSSMSSRARNSVGKTIVSMYSRSLLIVDASILKSGGVCNCAVLLMVLVVDMRTSPLAAVDVDCSTPKGVE